MPKVVLVPTGLAFPLLGEPGFKRPHHYNPRSLTQLDPAKRYLEKRTTVTGSFWDFPEQKSLKRGEDDLNF